MFCLFVCLFVCLFYIMPKRLICFLYKTASVCKRVSNLRSVLENMDGKIKQSEREFITVIGSSAVRLAHLYYYLFQFVFALNIFSFSCTSSRINSHLSLILLVLACSRLSDSGENEK